VLILIVKDELIEFCLMIRKFMLPTDQQLELDHWAETGDFNVTELHEVLVYTLHMWKHHHHHHHHHQSYHVWSDHTQAHKPGGLESYNPLELGKSIIFFGQTLNFSGRRHQPKMNKILLVFIKRKNKKSTEFIPSSEMKFPKSRIFF